jgi:(2Fe-2S) ferredoxin
MTYAFHVFCCTNRRPEGHRLGCCASKDSEALRAYMKARAKELKIPETRINAAGCLDRCADGPVLVVYPEGIWYRCESTADVEAILQEHLLGGRPVTRLQLPI